MSENADVENKNLGLGNSIETPNFKIRGKMFLLTLNQIEKYDELKKFLCQYSTLKYFISCKENAPTTGHEHIHIFLRFSQNKTLWAKKMFNVNIQKCDYLQKSIDYIKKDGNIIDEMGEIRQQGGICGLTIKQLKQMDDEQLDELPPIYYNIVEKIKRERMNTINIDDIFMKNKEVIYIYGKSGSGKSLNAYKMIRDRGYKTFENIKYQNGFWIGMNGKSECAVYDDFRDSDMKVNEFLHLIDYNKHSLNIKGGAVVCNYKLIIITSIISPWKIYKNKTDEEMKQWLRRMKIYMCDENGELNESIDFNDDVKKLLDI